MLAGKPLQNVRLSIYNPYTLNVLSSKLIGNCFILPNVWILSAFFHLFIFLSTCCVKEGPCDLSLTYFHKNCSFYYSKFRFMAVKGSSLTFKILKLKMSVRWTKHIISIFRFRFHRQLSRVILRYCWKCRRKS